MPRKLTNKQRAFTRYVVDHSMPVHRAFMAAGYSSNQPDVDAFRLIKTAAIRDAIDERRRQLIAGDMTSEALDTMRDLMGKETPAATRYKASEFVLKHAGYGAANEGGERERELTDMNADELAQAVQSGMGALAELAGQLQGHHVVEGQPRALEVIEQEGDQDPAAPPDFLE